ncbi:MAG: hypothetical protein JO345_05610 [Streptosporangiaceae bacterium]|nr:hypothetical protein [Streptosporangiaceae bacterium]
MAGSGRGLAARVLAAAQGHPKLLELADGQAADPARLGELLGSADHTQRCSAAGRDRSPTV